MIATRTKPTGGFVDEVIANLAGSGAADGVLDKAASAMGFDGFAKMATVARRGKALFDLFTPGRVAMISGGVVALTLAAVRVAKPGNATMIGVGVGIGTFAILKAK